MAIEFKSKDFFGNVFNSLAGRQTDQSRSIIRKPNKPVTRSVQPPVVKDPTILVKNPIRGPGPPPPPDPLQDLIDRISDETATQLGVDAPGNVNDILQGITPPDVQIPGATPDAPSAGTGQPPFTATNPPPGKVFSRLSTTGLPIFSDAPGITEGTATGTPFIPGITDGQAGTPDTLALLNQILTGNREEGQAGQQVLTDQLTALAQQNQSLADQVAGLLNVPTVQGGGQQQGSEAIPGGGTQPAEEPNFQDTFLQNLATALRDAGVTNTGELPNEGITIDGQQFFGSQGSGGFAGGAEDLARFEGLTGFEEGDILGQQGPVKPEGRAILPGRPFAEQLQLAAERAGLVKPGQKAPLTFRPPVNSDGDIIERPSKSDLSAFEDDLAQFEDRPTSGQQEFADFISQFPELSDFLDPIVAEGTSQFLGDISIKESQIPPGTRLITVPALNEFGQAVPGQLIQQFVGQGMTDDQQNFNLSQQPFATQQAAFQGSSEGSELAQLLQGLNPAPTPPSAIDQLLLQLVQGQASQFTQTPTAINPIVQLPGDISAQNAERADQGLPPIDETQFLTESTAVPGASITEEFVGTGDNNIAQLIQLLLDSGAGAAPPSQVLGA